MLEKNRKRAWRRVQETRVQTKRFHYYKDWFWSYSDDWSMRNKRNHSIADDPVRYAYLKQGHWSCGCKGCKPYKWFYSRYQRMKNSDQRRYQSATKAED